MENPNDTSDVEWVDVMPSTREYLLTAVDKISISEECDDSLQPYDVFSLIVTNDLIDMIVIQTNKYASDFINNSTVTRRLRVKTRTPTNNAEIKKIYRVSNVHGTCENA